ncbi:hypothetical protein F2Q68_00005878, partial [Brassica cretica]
ANEAKMVEEIADDVLDKLNLSPSDEFEDFVGIEDHIREMSSLLHLDSKEVKMVGIWGPSGIGKTTIARALFSRLSRRFQNSVFIDKVFISKSMEVHRGANLCDYNMKLHLQRAFLAEVLDKRDIKIDHIGAVGKMLRHRKALIFIDDSDDQDVLEALAGRIQWFGSGSRIIVVTKDKHLLRAHGIDHIYEVSLPSYKLAVEMFCRYAFRKSSPPDGFAKLASEVVLRAGSLPLGLNVLGSSLRGRDVEDWPDMLPRLRNALNMDTIKTLHVYENAFRRMCNLRFLEFDSQSHYMLGRAGQSHLPENFSYLPSSLKLLCWYGYPMRCMPSKFCPENLVMLKMRISMLEKLWEGAVLLPCLKEINLWGSSNLKVIPDLSKATNLERLYLGLCSSLLELSSSVRDLKKLRVLLMNLCVKVETIPAGIYLNSLVHLDLEGCSRFKTFPEIAEQDLTHTNLKSEKLREVVHKVCSCSKL